MLGLNSTAVISTPGGVVLKVAGGPRRQLQNLALGLRADPLTSAAEQDALEERDLAVVARRLLVLQPPDTFGLGGERSSLA
jgi:hypothetical protein